MSIKPKYADKILSGEKTVELRKTKPRSIAAGDYIMVYASSPKKCVMGFFEIANLIEADPKTLWKQVNNKAGIGKKEFENYFKDSDRAYGLVIKKFYPLRAAISLSTLVKLLPGFKAPQSYRYLSDKEFKLINEYAGGGNGELITIARGG